MATCGSCRADGQTPRQTSVRPSASTEAAPKRIARIVIGSAYFRLSLENTKPVDQRRTKSAGAPVLQSSVPPRVVVAPASTRRAYEPEVGVPPTRRSR